MQRCSVVWFLECWSLSLSLAATSWAQTRPPILEQIAKTYGLDSYGQIEAIRYTFNLEIPGLFKLSRTWEWEPKTGKVSYEGKDKDGKPVKVTYMRSELSSQPESVKKEIEPGFVNDNYWLLFPFHAYWDTSATVTDEGMKKLPVGAGSAELVAVKYPAEAGGYTPGDTWELYVGKDNRVEYLVFHHGGAAKPSLVSATWAGYKKAGPLLGLDRAPRHSRRQTPAPLRCRTCRLKWRVQTPGWTRNKTNAQVAVVLHATLAPLSFALGAWRARFGRRAAHGKHEQRTARQIRIGPTGTPSTWCASRPAKSCPNERRALKAKVILDC